MHRPVLVTAPANLPVTVTEVKAELPASAASEDALITALLEAATSHLDGWAGILGRCLVEQTWQQDFDSFAQVLRLPLGPVMSVASVKYRDSAGQLSTVASGDYSLRTDARGAYVRFKNDFSYPGDLYQVGAVSIEFVAGYPNQTNNGNPVVDGNGDPLTTVPAAIKQAIKLMVKKSWSTAKTDLFVQSETVEGVGATRWSGMVEVSGAVDKAVDMLLDPWRVIGV